MPIRLMASWLLPIFLSDWVNRRRLWRKTISHPYKAAPDHAFWERAVARNFSPAALLNPVRPLVAKGENVMSAGSCFAANLVPYLERAGIKYVRTEQPHPLFARVHIENFSYQKFSAAYGNIYTSRHLLQMIQRVLGSFTPIEDRWYVNGKVIDPFRPGLAFPALSDIEFDALTRQHLNRVATAIRMADVFVFTLGLTEAWLSKQDGAVFPTCPGTIAGIFDPDRHQFVNFSVSDVVGDLEQAIGLMRTLNPDLRIILTVSPVPLVATATGDHVLLATIHSKSILRIAAGELVARVTDCTYFPAYEIVTGPQAPVDFFQENRRDVGTSAIDTVMSAFISHCDVGAARFGLAPTNASPLEAETETATPLAQEPSFLSAAIADLECEEAASSV